MEVCDPLPLGQRGHVAFHTVEATDSGRLPDLFEIRGEIFFPLNNFAKLNERQLAEGKEAYANPRNTASGTLKLQDSSIVASRGLDCFLYSLYGEEIAQDSHFDRLQKAGTWG
ncbi:MAG: NAD-dependent DNA ligase LigA, partial [Planctomycetota bacterium]